jgi:tRNA dimethylallyltransferase
VVHHLLDVVGLAEGFDAARWLQSARAAAEAIRGQGRLPIVCGGTGLYFRAWIHGLDAPAPPDPALRRELEALPLETLLTELQAGDPGTFQRIDRRNPRRVIRAVEMLRASGAARPAPQPAASRNETHAAVVVLKREPGDLRRRIDQRVDAMFRAGLVEETRRLLAEGLAEQRTPMQAIGYRQVVEHLRGDRDLGATIALVKVKTWQYARRQETWFRHQLPGIQVEVASDEAPGRTAERVLGVWGEERHAMA